MADEDVEADPIGDERRRHFRGDVRELREERLDEPADHRRRFEPLVVLRRNSTADLQVRGSQEEWPWDSTCEAGEVS